MPTARKNSRIIALVATTIAFGIAAPAANAAQASPMLALGTATPIGCKTITMGSVVPTKTNTWNIDETRGAGSRAHRRANAVTRGASAPPTCPYRRG
jgi:hypothetical protein